MNTFSNTLEPLLKEIIKKLAIQYQVSIDLNQTLYIKITTLEDSIRKEKKEISNLHRIRMFRNNKAHPEKFQNLNRIKPAEKELLLSEMQTIISIIRHIREHFNV